MSQIKGNSIKIKTTDDAFADLKLTFVKCNNGIVIDSSVVTLAISKASLKELLGLVDLDAFKEWVMEDTNDRY